MIVIAKAQLINMKHISKAGFFALLAGIISVCSFTACQPEQALESKPNIIYILADDMGYADLACYGQQIILTPNLDQLASEGMKFTRHYAGTNICAPSRCVLMTGLSTAHSQICGKDRKRNI